MLETNMSRFVLDRLVDESGVSGEGTVAEGVIFADGTVAMRWLTRAPSTGLYASIVDVVSIHGHEGKTHVRLLDE